MKIWGYRESLDLLLINTSLSDYRLPHPKYTPFQPPLGLAILASYLERKRFKVGVWDAEADKISPNGIGEGVAALKPRWVGFNTFTSSFELLKETVDEIRKTSPETRIMFGGTHATTRDEDFLLLKEFEGVVVVRNDGELKAEAILNGRSLKEIPGISFSGAEGAVVNRESKEWLVQDIDHPAFELNRKFVPYDPTLGFIGPDGKRRAFVASSRGCPYECTFCASTRLAREGMPARYRKAENVVRELVGIIQSGVLDIKLNDELVWISEGRIRKILGPLKEMGYAREIGLEIRGNGRVNVIASASEETLDLMREVGVRKVGIGVEQGTEEGMKRVKKRITPEQVIQATTRLAERGIPVLANFMFGLPGEDERETRATVALARELVLIGRQYHVPIELDAYKYRPYPGTELWEELIREGCNPSDLKKVVQVKGIETGKGSHLQAEPYLDLADIDPEVERKHRQVLENLTEMNDTELKALEKEYPLSLCFEGQYSGGPERRHH